MPEEPSLGWHPVWVPGDGANEMANLQGGEKGVGTVGSQCPAFGLTCSVWDTCELSGWCWKDSSESLELEFGLVGL